MLGVVCVRGWLLVVLSFLVQMPGTSPQWPLKLCLLSVFSQGVASLATDFSSYVLRGHSC